METVIRRCFWPVYVLAMAGCLFLSLKIVFGAAGTDADSILSMTLWQGVQAHGIGWLRHFLFTPDNWLLSIVPFNFLSFALFGMQAWLVVASGWAVFALAALISALLARELGAVRWALLLPMPLLLLGRYAQQPGFVAYPVSHDVTNLYGLAALLCVVRGIRTGALGYFLLVFWLLVAGAISDPWMMTAYNLPLLLYCSIAGLRPSSTAREMQLVVVITLLAVQLVYNRMFGALCFLSLPSAGLAGWHLMAANFAYLVKDLGGLFNIVPVGEANDMVPALLSLAGAAAVGLVAWRAARRAGVMREAMPRLVFAVAGLSALFTVAGFVFLNITQGDFSGRYLVNILYLFAVLVAVALGRGSRQIGWRQKTVLGLFLGLFMACGLATTAPIWRKPGFAMQTNDVGEIIGFLQANGLNYGYGPYHGAQANAVMAMSDGRVTIRPARFDPKTGWLEDKVLHGQSVAAWLTMQDAPPGQKTFFVYVVADGEECPNPALCVAGLMAQFGAPERRLRNGAADILVWDHPLLASR